jgi:hypothetical protein
MKLSVKVLRILLIVFSVIAIVAVCSAMGFIAYAWIALGGMNGQ